MTTVNLEYAQQHLAELLDQAANGEAFVIQREGRRAIKLAVFDEPVAPIVRRLGFMEGKIKVPDDFDTMGQDEIIRMFEGEEEA
jgi:antitoxin (DNA-binding transcriptional repressor) of toxin-antitoxin stability system